MARERSLDESANPFFFSFARTPHPCSHPSGPGPAIYPVPEGNRPHKLSGPDHAAQGLVLDRPLTATHGTAQATQMARHRQVEPGPSTHLSHPSRGASIFAPPPFPAVPAGARGLFAGGLAGWLSTVARPYPTPLSLVSGVANPLVAGRSLPRPPFPSPPPSSGLPRRTPCTFFRSCSIHAWAAPRPSPGRLAPTFSLSEAWCPQGPPKKRSTKPPGRGTGTVTSRQPERRPKSELPIHPDLTLPRDPLVGATPCRPPCPLEQSTVQSPLPRPVRWLVSSVAEQPATKNLLEEPGWPSRLLFHSPPLFLFIFSSCVFARILWLGRQRVYPIFEPFL